jgi:hypothetical protein
MSCLNYTLCLIDSRTPFIVRSGWGLFFILLAQVHAFLRIKVLISAFLPCWYE